MTCRISLLIIVVLYSCIVTAQKRSGFVSLGISGGIPVNFGEGYNPGVGGGVRWIAGISSQGYIVSTTGIISFPAKTSIGGEAARLCLIKLGYRSFITNSKFFVSVDGGLAFKKKNDTDKLDADPMLSAGAGISIPAGKKSYIDIAPGFNLVFQKGINRTWLEVQVAYRHTLFHKK